MIHFAGKGSELFLRPSTFEIRHNNRITGYWFLLAKYANVLRQVCWSCVVLHVAESVFSAVEIKLSASYGEERVFLGRGDGKNYLAWNVVGKMLVRMVERLCRYSWNENC